MQAVARVFASRRAYESAQRAARRGQGPFVRDGSVRQLPGPLGAWTSARDLPPVAAAELPRLVALDASDDARRRWLTPAARSSAGSARRWPTCRRPSVRPTCRSRATTGGPTSARMTSWSPLFARARRRLPGGRAARRGGGAARRDRTGVLPEQELRTVGGPARPARSVAARPASSSCATTGSARPSSIDIDGALTGCAAAIAETGTIVLDGGALSGRRALTLVPDHHICVVSAEQIHGQIAEAVGRGRRRGHRAARPDHARLRAVGDLRHRARARRGRPRAAPSDGADRRIARGSGAARPAPARRRPAAGSRCRARPRSASPRT